MRELLDKERMDLEARIRKLRKRHDYSQETFAEALDISVITVSRIENGTTILDVGLLLKMSEVLEVPVDVILGTKGWGNPEVYSYWSVGMEPKENVVQLKR